MVQGYREHSGNPCIAYTHRGKKTMKLVILGAAGGTGRILVEQALEKGHEVTAFDRHTGALTIQHPKLSLVQGDVFDPAQVEAAIVGQDVVISVLGVKPGTTAPVCSTGTKNIITAMQKVGVKRFICQSTSAAASLVGERRDTPWVWPLLLLFSPKVKAMFADQVRQERFVRQSDLDRTSGRPTRLMNEPAKGTSSVRAP